MERLRARLDLAGAYSSSAKTVELQYSLDDIWSVRLFIALCRKHDVKPYRYHRQRRTTVMVRVHEQEFEETVATEFRTLHLELTGYFNEMVDHLIYNVMKSDGEDDTLEQRQIAM